MRWSFQYDWCERKDFTWLISSTHRNGHMVMFCKAIMYNITETLFSPPLWRNSLYRKQKTILSNRSSAWSITISCNFSPSRNCTLMFTPYFSKSFYKEIRPFFLCREQNFSSLTGDSGISKQTSPLQPIVLNRSMNFSLISLIIWWTWFNHFVLLVSAVICPCLILLSNFWIRFSIWTNFAFSCWYSRIT